MARLADDFAAIRTRLRELRGGRPAFMPADADATPRRGNGALPAACHGRRNSATARAGGARPLLKPSRPPLSWRCG
jgi:hypothetical protein